MPNLPLYRPTIEIIDDAAAAALRTAQLFERAIADKPAIVLGLATGNTPREVYGHLTAAFLVGTISFAEASSFNLDEYVGLSGDHPASFRQYMDKLLFSLIDINPQRAHVPDGAAQNLEQAALDYEQAIVAAGGIDLQLLGIGRNGHIGFNEPGSSHASRTRVVELTKSTIEANTRDFPEGETPPATALTMGIGSILDAREIVLLATGAGKAAALAAAVDGPVTEACPASALQLHPRVTIICDRAAAGALKQA